jgi:hypothetical protein
MVHAKRIFKSLKILHNPRILIAVGIGVASVGQLVVVRIGYSNLDDLEYGRLLGYLNLQVLMMLIFGAPAMVLGLIGMQDHTKYLGVQVVLTWILKVFVVLSLLTFLVSELVGNELLRNTSIVLGLTAVSVFLNSAQRGEIAAQARWGIVWAGLSLDGVLKVILLILSAKLFGLSQLGSYILSILASQLIVTLIIGVNYNPIRYFSKRNGLPRTDARTFVTLLGIWTTGVGVLMPTLLPIAFLTRENTLEIADIKFVGTCVLISRAPMSFTSAVLAPFVAEHRVQDINERNLFHFDPVVQFLKKFGPKLIAISLAYALIAALILHLAFQTELITTGVGSILIGLSNLIYFSGELLSSAFQLQHKFAHLVPGWVVSSLVLIVSLGVASSSALGIYVSLIVASTVLVFVQISVVLFSNLRITSGAN